MNQKDRARLKEAVNIIQEVSESLEERMDNLAEHSKEETTTYYNLEQEKDLLDSAWSDVESARDGDY